MKFFTNKNISKKIIIAILLVMSFNFISPAISNADDDASKVGGALFKPIGELLVAISDGIIILLQDLFLGNGAINYTVADGVRNYIIRYSPGVIFSNKVPGLDINFINPQADYEVTVPGYWYEVDKANTNKKIDIPDSNTYNTEEKMVNAFIAEVRSRNIARAYGFNDAQIDMQTYTKDEKDHIGVIDLDEVEYFRMEWEYNGKMYLLVITLSVNQAWDWVGGIVGLLDGTTATNTIFGQLLPGFGSFLGIDINGICSFLNTHHFAPGDLFNLVEESGAFDEAWTRLYTYEGPKTTGETIESTASILQEIIATWYVALRGIAIVLLLSVLVYIGIRILLSSTGETRARYKKMLMDWIAALCIIFVLQYIMALILAVSEKITQILVPYAIDPDGKDVLMSSIRNRIFEQENSDFFNIFSYVLIYVTLVVFTIIFTWQYLKRVIYIAFLTLISPLISLTYPIDKVKDGQAQAFGIWLREYIFNVLLQVVHLLVYCIFVGTGSELLVAGNPLFAVAAIGFLVPAEKFIKKLFGFDKANAGSVIGAAASGAFMMNMISNVKKLAARKKSRRSRRRRPVAVTKMEERIKRIQGTVLHQEEINQKQIVEIQVHKLNITDQ